MATKGIYQGGRLVGVLDSTKNQSREPTAQEKVINQPINRISGGGGGKSIQTTTPTEILISKQSVKESLKPTNPQNPYLIQQQVAIEKFKTERGNQNVPITKVFYVDPSTNTRRQATKEEYDYFKSQQQKELQARVELKGEKFVRRTSEKIIKVGQLEPIIRAGRSGSATLERARLTGEGGKELVNKVNIKIGKNNINLGSIKNEIARSSSIGNIGASFIPDTPLGIATTVAGIKYFGKLKQVYRGGISLGAGGYFGTRLVGASSRQEAISSGIGLGASLYGIKREVNIFKEGYSTTYINSQTIKLPSINTKDFVSVAEIKGTNLKLARSLIKTSEYKGAIPKNIRGYSAGKITNLERIELNQTGKLTGTITRTPTASLSVSKDLLKVKGINISKQDTFGVVQSSGRNIEYGARVLNLKAGRRSYTIGTARAVTGDIKYKKSIVIGRDLFITNRTPIFKIIPLSQTRAQLALTRPPKLKSISTSKPEISKITPIFEEAPLKLSKGISPKLQFKESEFNNINKKLINYNLPLSKLSSLNVNLPRLDSGSRSRLKTRQNEITPQTFKPISISSSKLRIKQKTVPIEKLISIQTRQKIPRTPTIIPIPAKQFIFPYPNNSGGLKPFSQSSFLVSVKSPKGFKPLARTRTSSRALNIGVGRVRKTRETTFKITPIKNFNFGIGTPKGFNRKGLIFSEKINLGKIRI